MVELRPRNDASGGASNGSNVSLAERQGGQVGGCNIILAPTIQNGTKQQNGQNREVQIKNKHNETYGLMTAVSAEPGTNVNRQECEESQNKMKEKFNKIKGILTRLTRPIEQNPHYKHIEVSREIPIQGTMEWPGTQGRFDGMAGFGNAPSTTNLTPDRNHFNGSYRSTSASMPFVFNPYMGIHLPLGHPLFWQPGQFMNSPVWSPPWTMMGMQV